MKFEKEIQFLEHNRYIISDEFLNFVRQYEDDTPITIELLKEYGFILERGTNVELQLDGIWYKDFNLLQDWDDESQFSFAVYVRSTGCLKSGYSISTLGRLKELYKGITGRELEKAPISNKL